MENNPRLIGVNPKAEADVGFELAQPGIYIMRIEGSANMPAVAIFDSKSGNKCLKVRLVFASVLEVTTTEGKPARNLGSIIDASLVIEPAEKQGKLRSFVESAGLPWSDFDIDSLIGREVLAKVGLEEYNGVTRNKIERYLKPRV